MSIDQELQAALNVDPSPEFVARVRSRIAAEPAPTRWGISWWLALASAAAVAVLVLAAVVWQRSTPATEVVPLLTARSLGEIAVPVVGSSSVGSSSVGSSSAGSSLTTKNETTDDGRRTTDDGPRTTDDAGILIDPREAAALRALLTGGPLKAENAYAGTSLDPLEIEPIVIAPLDPSGEGVQK